MIWAEMTYNSFLMDSGYELATEPEELDEYYKQNTRTKEEEFDEFEIPLCQ